MAIETTVKTGDVLNESLQIETAQVQAMNEEYEKLSEKNLSMYIVVINKKTGECKITPFDKP